MSDTISSIHLNLSDSTNDEFLAGRIIGVALGNGCGKVQAEIEENLEAETGDDSIEGVNLNELLQEIVPRRMGIKGNCRYKATCNGIGNIKTGLNFHYVTKNCPHAQRKFLKSFI